MGDGNATTGANYTTAIGYDALSQLTSGARNLAIGFTAMDALQAGNDNIAIGYEALVSAYLDIGDEVNALHILHKSINYGCSI